jgi:hypothetical protein
MPLLAFVSLHAPGPRQRRLAAALERPPLVWTATLIASSVKPNLC